MLSSFAIINLTLLFQNYLALFMFQLLARIAADGKPRIKDDAKLLCLITLEKNNASNQDEKHNSKM